MADQKESFSAGEASRISGVPYRNLDYWARTRFIAPSISEAKGIGTERKYAFNDLVALRVARQLREAGVSTQALRTIVKFLRNKKGLEHPLVEARLVVLGSDVKLVSSRDELISLLEKPGQSAFAFLLNLTRTVDEEDIHKIVASRLSS